MRIIGLISGTSVDAIDAALCEIGEDGVPHLLAHDQTPWPADLRARLLALLHPGSTSIAEVCELDALTGQQFAAAAGALVDQYGPVDLVASHGQTVHHWVVDGVAHGTLQLGEPAWIAAAVGVPVVSNLRAADLAAGGQGAPLVPILDVALFGDRPTAVVNLGGIANITILEPGAEPGAPARIVIAGDTGPANCLMDAVVARATGEPCDIDGKLAATGAVVPDLLGALRDHPWLCWPLPRSTGREVFSLAWFDDHLRRLPQPIGLPDQVATLLEFTASTLLDQIASHRVERLVVSGGGAHNLVLMRRLARDHAVVTTDDLGLPGDAKEAVMVALIGWLTWHGRPGVPLTVEGRPTTGAREARVLGDLSVPGAFS